MPSLFLEATTMLFDYIRILKNVGATLTDLSYENQDETVKPAITLPDPATDYLLIGMQYPFNNFFLNLTGCDVNDNASTLSLEYWDGSKWVAAVDVLDGTSLGGKTLARSGAILFSQDRQKTGWGRVNNTRLQGPPELNTKDIYDLYWLKLKVSAAIAPVAPAVDVTFQELGFAWTSGAKMKGIKSEVDRYLPSFATGKTNWIPEIMTACKMLITEMKKQGLVVGPQQMVRTDDFWLPATYKALWLVYSSLGPSYAEQATALHHQFYKTLNVNNVSIDEDGNGKLDATEVNSRVRTAVR